MLLLFPGENAARDTLRFAEEIAGYGLWQIDLASGEMNCSHSTCKLLGLLSAAASSGDASDSGETLNFATFEQVAHPEDIPIVAEIKHILAQGMPVDRQFRVVHLNGRVRAMAIHGEVLVGRNGKPERSVGVLMDITRHVETVMTSQITSGRVRELMTAIGGAIWTARIDGLFTDFLFRDPKSQVPATFQANNWHYAIHPDDLDDVLLSWNKAEADKAMFTSEHRIRCTDGQYRWRRAYATPITANDGSIREWVGISLSIHEHMMDALDQPPLTGAQIRAARGILNWSVRDLSGRAGLSVGVVRRLEETDEAGKNATQPLTLIKDALSAGGVDFFVLPSGEAGVCPTRKENRLKIVGAAAGK